ncbi:MAG: alpha/beta hydrolase [Chloroflexi bacterium]|nr:alpha/beta hydrolase [Chloroflexota bacterium]
MQHQEGTFNGSGGLGLYYQSWQPDGPTQAVVIIVHGHGEHSGRYKNVVTHLVPQGFALYGLDHRGHGRSPGQRGYVNNMADFRGDVGALVQLTAASHPGLPRFIYGHSLGGLIGLDYIMRQPEGLRGAIISAPAVGSVGVAAILLQVSRVLSRVWPTFGLETGLDVNAISRDPEEVKAYQRDPLVHGKGTARLATEVMDTATWCQGNAHTLRLPLLLIHGTADAITSPADSRRFFDNAASPDKTYIAYDGGYHESHNDIHHQQVVADLSAWLLERVNKSA